MTGKSREEKDRHNARRAAKRKAAKGDISAEIAILYKPLEQWDDEEIARGRPRDKHGGFNGARPSWLTPTIQAERQRRLRQLMVDELGTFAADALRTIHAVMTDTSTDDFGKPRVPAAVRTDAAKYLVDQFIGKATAKLDVTTHSPLEDLLSGILVNPSGEPSHQIIDGSVVEAVDPSEDEDQPDHLPTLS